MAYGQVTGVGPTSAELEEVKNLANTAKTTANQAIAAAGAAQDDATEALEILRELLGGEMPDPVLDNNSPETIKAVASLGLGPHFWNVGDKVGIQLNGQVSQLTLNATYYAFIIGFNHNAGVEGGNSIHFQFGKTATGVDIAFQSGWDDDSDFQMNPSNSNVGGWRDCPMRTLLNQSFLAAMPTAWRAVIAEVTKYTDNVGGGKGHVDGNISATVDKIWLLSEFEVHGTQDYANQAEQNYQKQYAYYANGNSRVKYKHDATGSAFNWWLRSPSCGYDCEFCDVSGGGDTNYNDAECSCGVAPGFALA